MKKHHLRLIPLVALLATVGGFAEGTHGGNGGVLMVCREGGDLGTQKPIERIELLDLYQANQEEGVGYGLPVSRDRATSPDAQIERALERLAFDERFQRDVRAEIAAAKRNRRFLKEPPEVAVRKRLPLTGDFTGMVVDDGCHYEQLADYRDKSTLLVDPELYRALSASPDTFTDEAAFWTHEAVYRVFRNRLHAEDSDLARELVALLFTSTPNPERLQKIVSRAGPIANEYYWADALWVAPEKVVHALVLRFDVNFSQSPHLAKAKCYARIEYPREAWEKWITPEGPSQSIRIDLDELPQSIKHYRLDAGCGDGGWYPGSSGNGPYEVAGKLTIELDGVPVRTIQFAPNAQGQLSGFNTGFRFY
jgi:hypothetical protein